MSRPPVFPVEDKIRIVLSVLAGEVTVAEAARRNRVSETSIGKWKQQFLEAGKAGLAAGGSSRPSYAPFESGAWAGSGAESIKRCLIPNVDVVVESAFLLPRLAMLKRTVAALDSE